MQAILQSTAENLRSNEFVEANNRVTITWEKDRPKPVAWLAQILANLALPIPTLTLHILLNKKLPF